MVAGVIAWRLFGLSTRQDAPGDPALTQKQRNLGTGALPLMAMVITFAGFDWLMSLNPIWFSTIFGVYYFAGSFWSTIAILIIVTTLARDPAQGPVRPTSSAAEHMHNLGKLLFAFTCFWGYIGFSQMMLIWIANLPEEIPFYIVRMKGEWAAVGIALIIGHFVMPFALLLSRDIKRKPAAAEPGGGLGAADEPARSVLAGDADPGPEQREVQHLDRCPSPGWAGRPGRGLRALEDPRATTRSRSRIRSWTSPSATGSRHEPATPATRMHAADRPRRTGTTAST